METKNNNYSTPLSWSADDYSTTNTDTTKAPPKKGKVLIFFLSFVGFVIGSITVLNIRYALYIQGRNQAVITDIARTIALVKEQSGNVPTTEVPVLAKITQDQVAFANYISSPAIRGDAILYYPTSQLMFVYRPSSGTLVAEAQVPEAEFNKALKISN